MKKPMRCSRHPHKKVTISKLNNGYLKLSISSEIINSDIEVISVLLSRDDLQKLLADEVK